MDDDRRTFWRDALAIHGSITPHVVRDVVSFGLIAGLICMVSQWAEVTFHTRFSLAVAPFEFAGAALGLLLILRTNSGYDRWWEARKLWGGIVNQSRNLAISAITYGPRDSDWQREMIHWIISFPHVARTSLRGENTTVELTPLLGETTANHIATVNHRPSYVARKLATLLRRQRDQQTLDGYAFLQIDQQRAQLIDHIGGCERILKTPLPLVYAIKLRRFIALFLLTLPFVLLHRMKGVWLVPLITLLVAYPLLALDQIGVMLQNPFSKKNLSHLPLDSICATIESNLKEMLQQSANENPT